MDEVVEALSGGIVAELLYLLVGDLAAPFDRSARGIRSPLLYCPRCDRSRRR